VSVLQTDGNSAVAVEILQKKLSLNCHSCAVGEGPERLVL